MTIHWLSVTAVYDYDEAGRLTTLTNFNGTFTTYEYDDANRLTFVGNWCPESQCYISISDIFALDGNGNRMKVQQDIGALAPTIPTPGTTIYGYNDPQKNRLLSAGSNNFLYDDEGQLSSGYGASYSFDYEHRLTGIGTSTQLFYDGAGNRLQAIRDGVVTRYIYDAAGNLLAEADGSNNILRYYIYGLGLLAMVTPSNQMYCYHFNDIGSVTSMTDDSQYTSVWNAYAYEPFGEILDEYECCSMTTPFKFVGQFGVMIEPNGFHYMRARYYDPNVGRFISGDPIGFDGGDVNLMTYVGNNPVNGIDPEGRAAFWYHFFDGYRAGRAMNMGVWSSAKLGLATMAPDFNELKGSSWAHVTRLDPEASPEGARQSSQNQAAILWSSNTMGGMAIAIHIWRDAVSHNGCLFPDKPNIIDWISHTVRYDLLPGGSFEDVIGSQINGSGAGLSSGK